MESTEKRSFNSLVEEFLGARLPDTLADNIAYSKLPADARGVILRLLSLMKRSFCPATEFTPVMIWLLSTVTPGMLPSAWGGNIPPVTSPGRHKKLDDYVIRQAGWSQTGQPVFIDLGCGFPPATTVDTAAAMPDWSVFGVDRTFARYVLDDRDGHYACFNHERKFQYLQSRLKPLNINPEPLKARFIEAFQELEPQLKSIGDQPGHALEKDGIRLILNPIKNHETENLKFIESDIEAIRLPPAQVVRCMNVLLYFEKVIRERMRLSIGSLLDDGGILISGFNHPFGTYARYAVYQKKAADLTACEFAFSLDNLRPVGIGPWLTLAENDEEAELLADLTGAIRSDRIFWPEFNKRVDTLQEKYGICRRGENGFNQFSKEILSASPTVMMKKSADLWNDLETAGYTDGAVEALSRAGYTAWKNPVGDIAVLPPLCQC